MSIKGFNQIAPNFVNKFGRAASGDSTGLDAVTPPPPPQTPSGITATGGIISDFTDPADGFTYRAHIFRSLDSFAVTGVTGPGLVDFLVVAGGGGGGGGENGGGGGGGAGGYRTSMPEGPGGPSPSPESQVTVSTGTYTVTIGAGGQAGGRGQLSGLSGGASNIAFPSAIPSTGGGGGAYHPSDGAKTGGSGGGGNRPPADGVAGTANQGFNGGNGQPYTNNIYLAGGGGGAGGLGGNAAYPGPPHPANAQAGAGGVGKLTTITGPTTITAIGFAGPGPVNAGWLAGGGGGGSGNEPPAPDDAGKGGGGGGGPHAASYAGAGEGTQYTSDGSVPGRSNDGTPYSKQAKANSGSGGGGGGFSRGQYSNSNVRHAGGSGGSGLVVIRYLHGGLTAKATGGAITSHNSKIIHIFQSSGTFTSTGGNITNCEIVCVAGGGGAGGRAGAGGGAGGYRSRTSVTIPSVAHTIVVGGGGMGDVGQPGVPGGNGGDSSIRDSAASNPFISFATGGGGGGGYNGNGSNGGSGGGVGWPSSLYSEGNTVASPDGHSPTVQGFRGGNTTGPGGGAAANPHSATGGGGGSAVGGDGNSSQPYTGVAGGNGGAGQQLPTTFHVPSMEPGAYTGSTRGPSPAYTSLGDSTFYANYGPGDLRSGIGAPGPATHPSPGSVNTNGKYWVCGGGGGGTYRNHGTGGRGGFPGSTASSDVPYAGGGHSFGETNPTAGQPGQHGFTGTGGGGGAAFYGAGDPTTPSENMGGNGGSGLVLIAYPE